MSPPGDVPVGGLLLAAGAGRRLGRPKALVPGPDGRPLVTSAVQVLHDGGCASVTVVLGAAVEPAAAAAQTIAGDVRVVVAEDWAEGMGASLRAGLAAFADDADPVRAVLVSLVDLPDLRSAVVHRVLDAWRAEGEATDALVRAVFGGRPGHPVLLGRDHWTPLRETLRGDVGAQPYLRARRVRHVECDDLGTGRDLDRPEDLTAWTGR